MLLDKWRNFFGCYWYWFRSAPNFVISIVPSHVFHFHSNVLFIFFCMIIPSKTTTLAAATATTATTTATTTAATAAAAAATSTTTTTTTTFHFFSCFRRSQIFFYKFICHPPHSCDSIFGRCAILRCCNTGFPVHSHDTKDLHEMFWAFVMCTQCRTFFFILHGMETIFHHLAMTEVQMLVARRLSLFGKTNIIFNKITKISTTGRARP